MHGVSFIIATYNCSKYIVQSIKSALDQQNCDIEVIVIDDASVDNTEEVVLSINSDKIKYIKLTENKGPSHARNIAINLASKEWVSILDSDDWIDVFRTDRLISYAISNNLSIIGDNQVLIDAETSLSKGLRFDDVPGSKCSTSFSIYDYDMLIKHPELGIVQPIFNQFTLRKKNIKYDDGLTYGEDYNLLLQLTEKKFKIGYLDEAMYYVNIRDNSLVSNRVKMFNGMIHLYKTMLKKPSVRNNQARVKVLEDHIIAAKRTVVYGAVVDNIKEKKYSQAIYQLLINPTFILQIPSRIIDSICVYWKR